MGYSRTGVETRTRSEEIMTDIREIAADYLHLAEDADGNVDRLRRKRHAELPQLADKIEALKKMPRSYRFSNPAAFAIAWEKWEDKYFKR
jgi:hypothetical protein